MTLPLPQLIAQELAASGIAEDVIAANVTVVPSLTFDPVTREVTGTPIASALNWTYTRFGHQATPDTWAALFIGADGECWQAKVFTPTPTQDGRSGRYVAPKGIGDKPFIPVVPDRLAQDITAAAGLLTEWEQAKADGAEFWQFVLEHPTIPLTVTEGAKKALSLLSQGILAIALYGCDCGARDRRVKPELAPYVADRTVIIAFDQDAPPAKRKRVNQAQRRLGKALEHDTRSQVFIATWEPTLGKGIDDVLSNDPGAGLAAIYGAEGFRSWRLGRLTAIDPERVTETLNRRYLGDLPLPPGAETIFLKSPKGTGKTESIAQTLATLPLGTPVLVLTHRTQLGEELATRFKVPYRTELNQTPEGAALGYVLCVDSLHPGAAPPFRPSDWVNNPPVVIIDECEQVLWHLLNSPTCREHRAAILKTLSELLQIASISIFADADLSAVSLDYFSRLRSEPNPVVIVNEYRRLNPRDAFLYDSPEAVFSAACTAIESGKKIIIHEGAQQIKSVFGTTNSEYNLNAIYPDKKILRIDRESVSEPGHPAFGCMGRLNDLLPFYDVVIASPTIETGVSLDLPIFDAVFYISSGLQTVGAACQTLERVRSDVPRHLFVPDFSRERIGNGADEPFSLKHSQQRQVKINMTLLGKLDSFGSIDGETGGNLDAWSKLSAIQNDGFKNYRESILKKLQDDGYRIIEAPTPDNAKEIGELFRANAKVNYQTDCEETAAAPIVTGPELKRLNDKREKSKSERQTEKASSIATRYDLDSVTPELIEADDDGLYPKLRLHYYLTVGNCYVSDRDNRTLETGFPGAVGFSPDVNQRLLSLRIQTLIFLNLTQFLDPDAVWTNETLGEWAATVLSARSDLRALLGTTFDPEKHTPIETAQRLLRLLGLRLECFERRRVKTPGAGGPGKITRFYRLAAPTDPLDRDALFRRWLDRDSLLCATAPQDKRGSHRDTLPMAA